MHNLVELWNTVLPTVTFVAIVGLAWKASAYCTNVNNKLQQLRAAVIKLEKELFEESFTETLSPIGLNDTGRQISKEINAESIVARLAEKIEIGSDFDAYQIQSACFRYAEATLFDELDDAELRVLRKVAFDRGHNIKSYKRIFGILIRDHWLSKLGKEPREVDAHDPELP